MLLAVQHVSALWLQAKHAPEISPNNLLLVLEVKSLVVTATAAYPALPVPLLLLAQMLS